MITLISKGKAIKGRIKLESSKSICNRLLIIQRLSEQPFIIENISIADDTQLLQQALLSYKKTSLLNTGAAGTAMRFLTAFLSIQQGEWTLTGSQRMKERPIAELVNALQIMGADISYIENQGFPPIYIKGKELNGGIFNINAEQSSQFITALLLIAPTLVNGITICLQGEIISQPYIEMTLKLMSQFGAKTEWKNSEIKIFPIPYHCAPNKQVQVEADWSSASYFYSIAALSDTIDLQIDGLQKNSLQADDIIAELFEKIGVGTRFNDSGIELYKKSFTTDYFEYNFSNCPDIAQTVAVVLAAKGIKGKLTGLKSLRIKETDRISALVTELNKLGFEASEGTDFIEIGTKRPDNGSYKVSTYLDHRMAMSFAPLALFFSKIQIENPEVVNKSYPDFWKDIQSIGIDLC